MRRATQPSEDSYFEADGLAAFAASRADGASTRDSLRSSPHAYEHDQLELHTPPARYETVYGQVHPPPAPPPVLPPLDLPARPRPLLHSAPSHSSPSAQYLPHAHSPVFPRAPAFPRASTFGGTESRAGSTPSLAHGLPAFERWSPTWYDGSLSGEGRGVTYVSTEARSEGREKDSGRGEERWRDPFAVPRGRFGGDERYSAVEPERHEPSTDDEREGAQGEWDGIAGEYRHGVGYDSTRPPTAPAQLDRRMERLSRRFGSDAAPSAAAERDAAKARFRAAHEAQKREAAELERKTGVSPRTGRLVVLGPKKRNALRWFEGGGAVIVAVGAIGASLVRFLSRAPFLRLDPDPLIRDKGAVHPPGPAARSVRVRAPDRALPRALPLTPPHALPLCPPPVPAPPPRLASGGEPNGRRPGRIPSLDAAPGARRARRVLPLLRRRAQAHPARVWRRWSGSARLWDAQLCGGSALARRRRAGRGRGGGKAAPRTAEGEPGAGAAEETEGKEEGAAARSPSGRSEGRRRRPRLVLAIRLCLVPLVLPLVLHLRRLVLPQPHLLPPQPAPRAPLAPLARSDVAFCTRGAQARDGRRRAVCGRVGRARRVGARGRGRVHAGRRRGVLVRPYPRALLRAKSQAADEREGGERSNLYNTALAFSILLCAAFVGSFTLDCVDLGRTKISPRFRQQRLVGAV